MKWKKLAAVLLAAAVILCLAACGSSDPMEGKWHTDICVSDQVRDLFRELQMPEEIMDEVKDMDLRIYVNMELKNGKLSISKDVKKTEESRDKYADDLEVFVLDMIYSMFDENMEKDAVNESFKQHYGVYPDEYAKAVGNYIRSIKISDGVQTVYYLTKDGDDRLWVGETKDGLGDGDNFLKYELDGDTLTFSEAEGSDFGPELRGVPFPVVFTR